MENPNSSNFIEFNKVWMKVQKDIPGIKRLDKTYDFITIRDIKDHWYADVFLGSFERIINITENGKPAGFIIRNKDDVLVNINSVYFMTALTNNFKDRENYNFECENNEMNVKINGSFGLEEVYNTYKQIEQWIKTPSITLKTDDMIIQEDKQLIADKSITVPKITESLKEEIKDIIFGEKRSLRIGDKTDKQIITFPSRVRETQFQLKSEEIAKKIPNADITFINGKEEKNIKKSENTNEKLHSQTNEHFHKTR